MWVVQPEDRVDAVVDQAQPGGRVLALADSPTSFWEPSLPLT